MTAEEFFEDNKLIPFHTDSFHYNEIYEIMKTFAKYHVEQALKEAVGCVNIYDYAENKDYSKFLEEDSILNAYPLTSIK
jgi:hypothetical protein